MEQGPGFIDLAIDSFELDAGAFWATPSGGAFGDRRGLELGLGFGLPLLGNARGPWIEARGLLRFADPARRPNEKAEGVFSGLLSWHEIVSTR
jgi:hypothetical protein